MSGQDHSPIPLIIDTDAGCDDACAIAICFKAQHINVEVKVKILAESKKIFRKICQSEFFSIAFEFC